MTVYESNKNRNEIKRVRYLFSGIVQGVGFRPFIYRQAMQNKLSGFVRNQPDGVLVEVQGKVSDVDSFLENVKRDLPPLAVISTISAKDIALEQEAGFRILSSVEQGESDVHIAPDVACCPECLAELFDPANRRFRYPFINCTNCGPRLTIINDIPYDRVHTSMACFPLCPECQAEYENPADRRFHAEPNACPVCGPQLQLLDETGGIIDSPAPVADAVRLIKEGNVLAIKGLGGFHLCVDASNSSAVGRLRLRKYREEKPLAVMAKDIDAARHLAQVNAEEEKLLSGAERPIVLLKKKNGNLISHQVAPNMPHLGLMLPYTPLQHLLLANDFIALVMTSANQVDEPICIGNREAVERLKGIADYFLVHNRDILVRCDDSVALVAADGQRLMRRSRGFAPRPVLLAETLPSVLALGPQLKATQCIIKSQFAFLSPHIGDLETPQARDFFDESLMLLKRMTKTDPDIVACDYHPAYYSTKVAAALKGKRVIKVQHHHAHIISCMAENRISGEVIGLAMDGTGYGLDGNAWGGEFLVACETEFRRVGHLKYFVLPGGEKAIHEPWRIGASLLKNAFGSGWIKTAERLAIIPDGKKCELLDRIIENRINSPLTSGLGRLFDGVAAILGLRQKVSFEGQAAMELEGQATISTKKTFPIDIKEDAEGCLIFDPAVTIRAMVEEILRGTDKDEIAAAFHQTLTRAFVEMSQRILNSSYLFSHPSFQGRPEFQDFRMPEQLRQDNSLVRPLIKGKNDLNRVVLSGGCFQNRLLLEGCKNGLEKAGFQVYCHRVVPANDGGVALGQAVVAGAIVKRADL